MLNKATYLGTVQDVSGSTISVALSNSNMSGVTYVKGNAYKIGQVGNFVKIPIGYIELYGLISQVGASAIPDKLSTEGIHGDRWLTVQLIGEGNKNGTFERGISNYPTINDEVHLVSESDLKVIYGQHDKPYFVKLGCISGVESIPALFDINKLVTRHCAIVGSTGSGKSTTVASILNSLSDQERYPSARIIVIDIHGEYAKALRDRASVFRINAKEDSENFQNLVVPFWALNSEELIDLTFGPSISDKDKIVILERIYDAKLASIKKKPRSGLNEQNLSVDSPVPFSIHKLWYELYSEVCCTYYSGDSRQPIEKNWAYEIDENGKEIKGDAFKGIPPKFKAVKDIKGDDEKINYGKSALNIRSQLESLGSKLRIPRYDFLFRPDDWTPDLEGNVSLDIDHLIKDWIGSKNPIAILDLSGIPLSILNTIIGVVLRILYDALFWGRNLAQGGRLRPLLIVMEEAHNYLNETNKGNASEIVQKIFKEGRKYGIGAMVVSQRPSEINTTILSQCGTFIALRLTNSTDRSHIASAVSDNLEGLTSMLPILKTGEAIAVGEAVKLPMRIMIEPPEKDRRPDSQDPVVYDEANPDDSMQAGGWGLAMEQNSKFEDLIEVWRRQDPILAKIKKEKKMERQNVTSSNIKSVGYDKETNTLEVEFNNGGIYQYFDVPEQVAEALLAASSVGGYLASNVKNSYRFIKV